MAKEAKLTPMMRQYRDAKQELSDDVILLFRMGDFYEMFFEDATRGSQILDITLTKRQGVPMAGIPYHALQNYLPKILGEGVKVAIAEQMEDPKLAKGLVKREITQIITPGTIVEGDVLQAGQSNFLVSVYSGKRDRFGVACLDISTAEFRITECQGREQLEMELHRLKPAECLLPDAQKLSWEKDNSFPDGPKRMLWTGIEDWTFDEDVSREELCRHFDVASLDGFGCREFPIAVRAAGAVLYYAQNNLRRNADHITVLRPYAAQSYMMVDRISQRNLELVEPLFSDSKDSTLLSVLNCTVTPMGSRMMREWILRPLMEVAPINERLDAIQAFFEDQLLLAELREALGAVRDIERTISRLNVGSANARDLLVLNRGLSAIPGLKSILTMAEDCELIGRLNGELNELPAITELIDTAIAEEPPITIKEGGIIKEGYNEHLDQLRQAATQGKSWIADLQAKEQERTGINALKIRYNKVFGYFIEVRKSSVDMVPDDYVRKQTLTNAERFIMPELKELEDKVLGSEDKSKALEYEIFQEIRAQVIAETATIQNIARAIGQVDAIGGLAEVALRNDYCRPELVDEPLVDIKDGRHPVIDRLMKEERFVPNDTKLDCAGKFLVLITGPNMAGKSTYIRQVALLTLMAQMGSFIPANSARIGIADRIFTRIGAADDLSRGQSTFMVEMLEAANILNNATERSLIILDEIGRGTSTYDGLSIAWAVTEYIHNEKRCRTLFATHYHELTQLYKVLRGVFNANVAVREWGDKVIFLHQIMEGPADKSYGIHVARLAGLPKDVLDRANEVLTTMEGNNLDVGDQPKLARSRKRKREPVNQPTLFDMLEEDGKI